MVEAIPGYCHMPALDLFDDGRQRQALTGRRARLVAEGMPVQRLDFGSDFLAVAVGLYILRAAQTNKKDG